MDVRKNREKLENKKIGKIRESRRIENRAGDDAAYGGGMASPKIFGNFNHFWHFSSSEASSLTFV